jgi:eukaryotic-like serine/threonine-protein kinase
MVEPKEAHPRRKEALSDLTGTTVGRFVIRTRLDSGHGMGEVYCAEDMKLKRPVALKRVSPKLRADAHYRQRFLKEAERASCLSDPHIASVYDVLEEKNETFLVMEYVEGTTLRPRLQRPFALEEFLPVAIQCAQALRAAHEKGIIHRDIKPENIMLTAGGQVKILDFGVARRLMLSADSDATASIVSEPGTISGTPSYMAPEVLLEKESDGRSDIFSLGIVFYEMLTGRHPFRSDSFMATADRILHEIPRPISQINPQVPGQLECIITKMLNKNPAERQMTAQELLEQLKSLERKESGLFSLAAVLERKIVKRKTTALVLLGVVLLLIASGLLWYRFGRDRQHTAPPQTTGPNWMLIADFQNRTGDEFFDFTARELFTIAIEQSRMLNVFPRRRVLDTLKLMQKPADNALDPAIAREICLRENLQTFVSGEIVPAVGGYQVTVKAVDPRNDVTLAAFAEPFSGKQGLWTAVDRISTKLRGILGEELSLVKRDSVPLERATTHSLQALERFSRALELQAAGKIEEALTLMKAAVELDPEFAVAHSRMAVSQMALGAEEEALESSSRAYGLRNRVSERERYQIQATYHRLRLDYEAALRDSSTMAVLYPNDPTVYSRLADNHAFAGKLTEAIQAERRAVDLFQKNVLLRGRLIELLSQAGRTDDALREIDVARRLGADMPAIAGCEAFAWLMKGNAARARQALQPVLSGSDGYYEELGRLDLARIAIYEGKFWEVAKQLESDLGVDLRTDNESYAEMRHYWLARVYLLLGQRKLALEHLDALLAGTRISPIHLHQLRQAGLVCAEMGEVSRAQRVLRELEKLQSAFPSNFSKAAVTQLQGRLNQATGLHAEAQRNLYEARALWGGVLSAWSLATYWEERNDYGTALIFYQEVITRKGDVLQWDFPGFWALAHLRAARCYQRLGNVTESIRLRDEFSRLWPGADTLPSVKMIKDELGRLNSP